MNETPQFLCKVKVPPAMDQGFSLPLEPDPNIFSIPLNCQTCRSREGHPVYAIYKPEKVEVAVT